MLARVILLLVFSLPQLAAAQVLVVAKNGSLYTLESAADGTPKLVPYSGFKQVIFLGDSPNPPPPPPGPTPVLTERAKQFQAVAAGVAADPDRATTAIGLATIYRELAKAAPQYKSDPATLLSATMTMSDAVLNKQGSKAAWQPFKDQLNAQWTRESLRGQSADFGVLLTDAADGLVASAPLKQVTPEFWAFLLELLKILLPLLLPLLKP